MAFQPATSNLLGTGTPPVGGVGAAQQQQATSNLLGSGVAPNQQATSNLLGSSPNAFGAQQQQSTSGLLAGASGFGASNFGNQQATSNLLAGGSQQQASSSNFPSNFGTQPAATSNLLGGGTQQQATSGLLGGATGTANFGPSNFGTQQGATSALLGSSEGTHAQQQHATSALLAPSHGATGNLLGANQQGNTSKLLGNSALDMTAGQLTPLNEPPGTASAARFAHQQEQTNRLLGTQGATQQDATNRLLGTEGFPKQQDQTSRLLGSGEHAPYPTQQGATSRLLGGNEGIATQQDATSRLMADGLRQRNLSQHAKKALDRADADITRFGLILNGEIQSAHLGSSGRGPLMCVFSMKHGADWTVVSGAQTGITQLATSSLPAATALSSAIFRGGDPREVVWNFPIGMAYKSTSPFGWPRLVVTVYGTDLCNRRVIKGYGSVHVPCQPGKHTRTIRLYCPLSSSPMTRLLGALFGNPAQLVDPRIVAESDGREVVRVQSGGKVTVTFDVLLKDTEPFNYSF